MHKRSTLLLAALALGGSAVLAGGSGKGPSSTGPVRPATPASSVTPASPAAPAFQNPVIGSDFPDPTLLRVGRTYYAYSTNTPGVNVPVQRSDDLVHWTGVGDALPEVPAWATAGNTWAPSVSHVKGGYRLYFTARHTASGRQCLGVATAARPEGPYVSASPAPLVCQLNLGGSIDAQAFTDTGERQYLYWKSDGNCCGLSTHLYVQPLSADGLALKGKPVDLLHNDQPWEGNLIEAPSVYRHGGRYYLFYSAGAWNDRTYAVGYADGPSPLGPFKKAAGGPILATSGEVVGPGGQGVITDLQGHTWMYYHAWTAGLVGYDAAGDRSLRLDPLTWKGGVPVVKASTRPEPAPARP